MAKQLITLRDGLHTVIAANQASGDYVLNNFTLSKKYYSREDLARLPTGGRVNLAPVGFDQERITRNGDIQNNDQGVIIGIQMKVSPDDDTKIDQLVDLFEELMATTAEDELGDATYAFTWVRNEAQRDESGFLFDFGQLREYHLFESYFTAFYMSVQEASTTL